MTNHLYIPQSSLTSLNRIRKGKPHSMLTRSAFICCDCYAFGSLLSSQFVNTDGAHDRHRHIISTNICEAFCRLLTKSSNLCGKIRSKTISEKFSLEKKKPKRFLHIQLRWFIDGFTWNFGMFEEIERRTS